MIAHLNIRNAITNSGENIAEAGMQTANFFESICMQILSGMILGALVAEKSGMSSAKSVYFVMLPLALGCLDIISSTIGMWSVYTKPGLPAGAKDIQNLNTRNALYSKTANVAKRILGESASEEVWF